MMKACHGPPFCDKWIDTNENVWKTKSCVLVTLGSSHPRGKLNDINSTVAVNEVVFYCPMRGYKKKNEANRGLRMRNKLVHPWWFITVSLPGLGQPRKFMSLSSIQWVSIEQKTYFGVWKYDQEGVTPLCNLPLLGLQYKKPILFQNSHPPQSSQSWETWRTWSQHCRQVKYSSTVRLRPRNTLFLRT